MSTDTPTTNQCSICLDGPPYDKCAGLRTSFTEVAEAASCAYLIELEAKLAAAQATIAGDGKVIDLYRERLSSVTEERDSLKRELAAYKEIARRKGKSVMPEIIELRQRAELAEQQLAASREAVIEECAKVCEDLINVPHGDGTHTALFRHMGNQACAKRIRALSASAAKEGG